MPRYPERPPISVMDAPSLTPYGADRLSL